MISLRNLLPLLFLPLLAISFSSCDEDNPFEVDYSSAPEPFNIDNATRVESETGLIYYIVEEGSGAFEVDRRDQVRVYYTGRRYESGDIFDSSYRNGNPSPATFNSLGNLISGFREGLIGMKEGGKRVLIIPPELAYGNSPNSNLKNDTLRFDIELAEIISF
ncbi:MAG: FKBP-type peptidyl-prolyl cis-trans isomerase [Gracilimonas sp.]|uniref:FKBP-type peptidyl-prolyl cis-trans isomerase n=1 Tax=Gracilimonas sp. TaxID=1974203 RepID=UPI0019C7C2CB|nr:FKBP-type peptidyl-prolyl cis-trans isomerase [Gracilimonas sp.]MBD3615927.1 FKBP-type peptidyl-prolyl cis-trans isomerase [Gracilimonas sp.]